MNGFESALSLGAEILRAATMPSSLGVAVWVLAVVFAWSGTAKLRRPARAAMAIVDFGVVRGVRPALGGALGGAELALAVALISGAFPGVSLTVAAGVLWLFVALVWRSLREGERFACFCFGEADSSLSGRTLLRTAALALLASLVAVSAPASGVFAGFGSTYALQALSAAAFVGALALVVQIPKLLRWNKDPYKIGSVEGIE